MDQFKTQFTTRNLNLLIILSFGLITFAGCTKKDSDGSPADGKATGEINLAIWTNFISPDIAQKFTAQTGIKLNISNYSSNEDLLAKVQVGGSGIDVAVPSDYMVDIMAKQGLLLDLQKSQIPNFSALSAEVLRQNYDPDNKYSVPYSWSTSGIAVNRELYKGKIESWNDVLENEQLKGKISLLDDVREATGLALKHFGYSLNTTNEKELKAAKEYLFKVKKNVKVFQSDAVDLLTNKEVVVAQVYSSDALKAWARTDGKIEYILPKEGSSKAIDNMVILKNSKNPEAAHKLINFLLSEEANIVFVRTMFGGPVLKSTRDKLEPKIKDNTALFPSESAMKKLEAIVDLGEKSALYDDLWVAVKTTN